MICGFQPNPAQIPMQCCSRVKVDCIASFRGICPLAPGKALACASGLCGPAWAIWLAQVHVQPCQQIRHGRWGVGYVLPLPIRPPPLPCPCATQLRTHLSRWALSAVVFLMGAKCEVLLRCKAAPPACLLSHSRIRGFALGASNSSEGEGEGLLYPGSCKHFAFCAPPIGIPLYNWFQ